MAAQSSFHVFNSFFNFRGVCLCWIKWFCARLWLLSTQRNQHIIFWNFQEHCTFMFHIPDGLNMAAQSNFHIFYWFFQFACSLYLLNIILLCTFVCSNQRYASRRWFPESFTEMTFLFFTFQMGSTLPKIAIVWRAGSDNVEPIWKMKTHN